ncbi:MAG TPA: alpha/beta hydrolase [bacterium]|nr:alpha/beta hydrolase [bacterium]
MTKFLTKLFLLMLFLLIGMSGFVACDDDDDDNDDDNDAGDDDDDNEFAFPFDDLAIEWESCSLAAGYQDGRAQCATVEMPFNWFEPDGRTFKVFVKRLLSTADEVSGQLWLLHGGPGGAGSIDLPGYMDFYQRENPDIDLYTIDARGTGYSEYVGCPDQESYSSSSSYYIDMTEIPACVEYLEQTYGEDLSVYNATNAAIDLAAMIHHTRKVGQKVFVWGSSGGTYWAQRYLQFFPDGADGIIVDSIAPTGCSLVFQDEYADKVTARLLEMCAADEFCAAKLPDPETTLRNLWDKMNDGHCSSTGLDALTVKIWIDNLVYYYPYNSTVPALIYRLDRCDEGDRTALVTFFNKMFGSGKSKAGDDWGDDLNILRFSYVLFFNQLSSEMWEHQKFTDNDALLAYLDGVYDDGLMGFGKGYDRNDIYLQWPRYDDPYDEQWPETDVPMLMLQGKLDPATPYDYALEMTEHFDKPHQYFAGFEYAAHGVGGSTPLTTDDSGLFCADILFFDFIHDPQGELDMSCIDQTLPPDFEGTLYGPYLFGTPDYWENPTIKSAPALNPPDLPPRFRLFQREIQQRFWARYSQQVRY